MQPRDVPTTCADISDIVLDVDFCPNTPIDIRIQKLVNWYTFYYICLNKNHYFALLIYA